MIANIDITNYADYRIFLNDRFKAMKMTYSSTSFQDFANNTGTSRSYLKLIISQKRHSNLERIFAISSYLKLSNWEKMYFIFLFLKNTSKEVNLSKYFEHVLYMFKNRPNKSELFPTAEKIDSAAKREAFFGQWLPMTIHAMATVADVDLAMIQTALIDKEVQPEQIEKAVQLLVEAKAVSIVDGKIRAGQSYFEDLSGFLNPEGLKKYIDGHDRIKHALTNPCEHRPMYNNYCVATLSEEEYKVVSDKLREATALIRQFSAMKNEKQKQVYLLSTGLCAMARIPQA